MRFEFVKNTQEGRWFPREQPSTPHTGVSLTHSGHHEHSDSCDLEPARDAGFSYKVVYACVGTGFFGFSFLRPLSAVRLVDDNVDDHTMHAYRTVFLKSFPDVLGQEYL